MKITAKFRCHFYTLQAGRSEEEPWAVWPAVPGAGLGGQEAEEEVSSQGQEGGAQDGGSAEEAAHQPDQNTFERSQHKKLFANAVIFYDCVSGV